jgi:hypothetical protein
LFHALYVECDKWDKETIMYSREHSAAILKHIESTILANNGYIYIDIDTPNPVTQGLIDFGFIVYRSRNQFDRPTFMVLTQSGYNALSSSPYGKAKLQERVKFDSDKLDRMVVAQQERLSEYF